MKWNWGWVFYPLIPPAPGGTRKLLTFQALSKKCCFSGFLVSFCQERRGSNLRSCRKLGLGQKIATTTSGGVYTNFQHPTVLFVIYFERNLGPFSKKKGTELGTNWMEPKLPVWPQRPPHWNPHGDFIARSADFAQGLILWFSQFWENRKFELDRDLWCCKFSHHAALKDHRMLLRWYWRYIPSMPRYRSFWWLSYFLHGVLLAWRNEIVKFRKKISW